MKKPSASQIVPVELQQRLQQHAHQSDLSSWMIGDIAVLLEDEYSTTRDDGTVTRTVPVGVLHNAIGVFANRSGETVRDYAYVSRRVPPAIREEFDMLGRHHHKAAADVAKGDTKQHRALCLKWLEMSDDYGGQIGSVGAFRMWLKQQNGAPAAWESRLERAKGLCGKLAEDKEAPAKVRRAASGFLEAVG